MSLALLDPLLVVVLLLNFFVLVTTRLRSIVQAVALQGALLGVIYPLAHTALDPHGASWSSWQDVVSFARLMSLTLIMILVKGWLIPQLLTKAIREVQIGDEVESLIGFVPTLLLGALGTGLSVTYAATLPLKEGHRSALIIPAALATCFAGFLLLTTRRTALTQVLGYLVLENGIFIFGMLLVEAMPLMVEVGVLLDVFVGVFVMGIIINHVSREFPSASSEHLSTLRE